MGRPSATAHALAGTSRAPTWAGQSWLPLARVLRLPRAPAGMPALCSNLRFLFHPCAQCGPFLKGCFSQGSPEGLAQIRNQSPEPVPGGYAPSSLWPPWPLLCGHSLPAQPRALCLSFHSFERPGVAGVGVVARGDRGALRHGAEGVQVPKQQRLGRRRGRQPGLLSHVCTRAPTCTCPRHTFLTQRGAPHTWAAASS